MPPELMPPENERLATLTQILRDLLGDDRIVLTAATLREDVPGWDSFTYVNFIVAVEAAYGIRFRIADVESFQDVGAIVAAIGTAAKR
jgi:acyl carrier protein